MEFNRVELTVRCDMHVRSVQPVLGRVDSAAVDVSERRNPVISLRIVKLALVWLHDCGADRKQKHLRKVFRNSDSCIHNSECVVRVAH